jgi:hypothetical protein
VGSCVLYRTKHARLRCDNLSSRACRCACTSLVWRICIGWTPSALHSAHGSMGSGYLLEPMFLVRGLEILTRAHVSWVFFRFFFRGFFGSILKEFLGLFYLDLSIDNIYKRNLVKNIKI